MTIYFEVETNLVKLFCGNEFLNSYWTIPPHPKHLCFAVVLGFGNRLTVLSHRTVSQMPPSANLELDTPSTWKQLIKRVLQKALDMK